MNRRDSKREKAPTPKAASWTTSSGARGRPIGRLRTIDEAAEEVLNTSSRTVRRLIDSGA